MRGGGGGGGRKPDPSKSINTSAIKKETSLT